MHTAAFVSEFRFVPVQSAEMEEEILSAYSQLKGRTPAEAESEYLRYVDKKKGDCSYRTQNLQKEILQNKKKRMEWNAEGKDIES